MTLFGQIPSELWQFGFAAVMAFIMLGSILLAQREFPSKLSEIAKSIDRLTRIISTLVLSMEFLPDAFHESAKQVIQELDDKERSGK